MRHATLVLAIAALIAAALAPSAQAAFGLKDLDVSFSDPDGLAVTQAGSHPFAITTTLAVNTKEDPAFGPVPEEDLKDLFIAFPPGLVADRNATPRCSSVDFVAKECADGAAVGVIDAVLDEFGVIQHEPVFNLTPPPGGLAKLGFKILGVPVTIDLGLNPLPPYNGFTRQVNIPQILAFYSAKVTIWGDPGDSAHDDDRGDCATFTGSCQVKGTGRPFLTLPRSCDGPLATRFEASSWLGSSFEETILSHGDSPAPLGMTDCAKLAFGPTISAEPTSKAAQSPSGLDFSLDVADEGLLNPSGIAGADISKAIVTLPEGFSANPSLAEGLGVCGAADLDRESATSAPGFGCPEAAKIGTVQIQTPLLEESLAGTLFIAKPYENPFGSLLALYLVIKDPDLGILVKQPLKVVPDPVTGQLRTIAEDLPQLPFSHFKLHFREGGRSPLVTPPRCGTYEVKAELTPSSGNPPLVTGSTFEVLTGPNEGPCPPAGKPPFDPGFQAGSINNNAGSFSPFNMRLTRADAEADMTRFSAKLPPGMVAKLAGTTRCPDAAIASAKAKSGLQERATPSCPASSKIGRVLGGAGAGSELTYVPGSLYMAGPYNGAPLSVVAIVPAVAGPFDVGTVVVRQALRIDPRSAVVTADGAASDPLPHILAGIPLNVRDIRVYVDRPDFTLNPTSCEPFAVKATIWGGGTDVFSSADDSPLSLADRFQAANCANLGFRPRLSLKLKGGTKRGRHPALTGTYSPRPGDANLANLVLRLPRSAFLDQAHIRTICTRVQFAAKSCPAGAVYGQATAYTPILDEPLKGPVYLRSSNHNLPDFVADLHGLVDVEAVARIDSKQGGIRASFEDVPDAPLSKVVVRMQGAKKGLIVNSRNLCGAKSKANAEFTGQNGKQFTSKPVVQADCGGGRKGKRRP
jgi:hypothetical protein